MPHVIFLEPGFPANQREFVRALHRVGATVSGIGAAPIEAYDAELQAIFHGYEQVPSTASPDALTEAVRRIQARGPAVQHLVSTLEALMLPAARARERTAIPGMGVEQATRVRDKSQMKRFLAARGIPVAPSAEVRTVGEALAFAARVGFPLVVKPLAAAGAAGTWKVNETEGLRAALDDCGAGPSRPVLIEGFIDGDEGIYDTLTVGGDVVFEQICRYHPNVLTAMRDRSLSPVLLVTNRMDAPGYDAVKALGRRVLDALELRDGPTHMEWFKGPGGLLFSEIGARPPGVRVWDLYCAANELDLYAEWARALCFGEARPRPTRRYAAGMVAIRPNRDGRVIGYSGVDEIKRRFGPYLLRMHLPPVGATTQPVESGYMGNAWFWARHPDEDRCRAILEEIGRVVKMRAE